MGRLEEGTRGPAYGFMDIPSRIKEDEVVKSIFVRKSGEGEYRLGIKEKTEEREEKKKKNRIEKKEKKRLNPERRMTRKMDFFPFLSCLSLHSRNRLKESGRVLVLVLVLVYLVGGGVGD